MSSKWNWVAWSTTRFFLTTARSAGRLAARYAITYPRRMCRDITGDQRREGWRAFAELLAGLKTGAAGAVAAALTALVARRPVGGRRP